MRAEVTWSLSALEHATSYLADDRDGLEAVLDATDLLARDPYPEDSADFVGRHLRHLRVGRFRLLYEVDDAESRVVVVHLGRLG